MIMSCKKALEKLIGTTKDKKRVTNQLIQGVEVSEAFAGVLQLTQCDDIVAANIIQVRDKSLTQ